jgi:hypothetical protein
LWEPCLLTLVFATALLLSSMQYSFLSGGTRAGVYLTAILHALGVLALSNRSFGEPLGQDSR